MAIYVAKGFLMLTVDECKRYLPDKSLSNAQIEEIRDALYQMAHILVEQHLMQRNEKNGNRKAG